MATYASLLQPALGSPHAGALGHIVQVSAHSDTEVDFVLARRDPEFPARLTIGIAPKDRLGDGRLARKPMGSGPADPTMRTLKLLRGEADMLQNDLPSELFAYLDQRPGLQLREHPGTPFAYIGFNLADPVLADHRVRAAVAHAIDRAAIIRHLFAGRAQTAESVLRPEHWAGTDELKPYAYAPALARDYLRSAGYSETKPLRLSYKTSTDPFRLRIAHVFQSQLADVGIELKISSYDWGTFFGDIKAGRFQMYSLAWVGVNTPDILRYAFHSDSKPPAGANRGQYVSAAVDALIEEAERSDLIDAAPMYAEIQRQIHDELVYVPLWYESNIVVSRGLSGYEPRLDGGYLALNTVKVNHEAH